MSQNMRRLPPGSLHLAGLLSPSFIRVATPAGCPFSRRGRVTVHVASFPRLPGTWAVSWSRPREDSCSPPCSRNAPHAPPRALTARQRHLRLSCPQESDSGLAVPSPPLLRPLHPPHPGALPPPPLSGAHPCRGLQHLPAPALSQHLGSVPSQAFISPGLSRPLQPGLLLPALWPVSAPCSQRPQWWPRLFLGPAPRPLVHPSQLPGTQELPFCSLLGQGWAAAPFFPGVSLTAAGRGCQSLSRRVGCKIQKIHASRRSPWRK